MPQRSLYRVGATEYCVLLVLNDALRQTWRNNNGEALELSWRRALIPWLEPVAIPRTGVLLMKSRSTL